MEPTPNRQIRAHASASLDKAEDFPLSGLQLHDGTDVRQPLNRPPTKPHVMRIKLPTKHLERCSSLPTFEQIPHHPHISMANQQITPRHLIRKEFGRIHADPGGRLAAEASNTT